MSNGSEQTILTVEMLLGVQNIVENLEELVTKGTDVDDVMIALGETVEGIADKFNVSFEEAGAGVLKLSDVLATVDVSVKQVDAAVGNLNETAGAFKGVKTTSSVAETKIFRAAVDRLKETLKSTALAAKASFSDAAEGMRKSGVVMTAKQMSTALREVEKEGKAINSVVTAFRGMSTEMKNTQGAVGGLRKAFDNMGTTIQTVFGFTLANIATRVLRAFTDFVKKAIEAGNEFTKSLFRMSVGIRALESSGMDVTISEFTDKIKELQETWGTFTTRELVDAVGYMTLLTREVGLTKNQMLDLMDASAALSVLLGKDMNETLRQVSLAISSGYAEALQRAGLNVNKVEIAHKALEMGIDKTFMAMTGEERALVTLTLILEQTSKVTEDAAKWQETLGGQIEKNTATLRQFTDYMGTKFLPIWANFIDLIADASDGIMVWTDLRLVAQSLSRYVLIPVLKSSTAIRMMWKNLTGKGEYTLDDFKKAAQEIRDVVNDSLRDALNEKKDLMQFPLGDIGADAAKSFIKAFNEELAGFELSPEAIEAFEELKEIFDKVNEDIADEMEDFHRSQLINQRKFSLKLEQLLRNNAAAREKIIRKTNDKIESENIKYQQNLADAQRDYLEDQAQAELDYRRRELDAERDYQDEIRKMRDQLLFDLEEAVRQRDASQIRRLLRLANFRKDQLGIDREREREENKARLERELADNKLKLKRELADIRRAHEIRLREIRIDGKRQLAELARNQQAKMQALMEQERLERELAEEKHRRELEDIRSAGERKLRLWTENFAQMMGLTADATNQIYKYLSNSFGPGGSIEGLFQYLTDMITQMVLQFQALAGSMKSLPKGDSIPKGNALKPPVDATPWAEGGTLIANKPTLAVFGEGGAERVDFTPIGRQGANVGKVFGGALPSGSDGQKLALEILLSPDLEARVIESSLGELSDILVSVERAV